MRLSACTKPRELSTFGFCSATGVSRDCAGSAHGIVHVSQRLGVLSPRTYTLVGLVGCELGLVRSGSVEDANNGGLMTKSWQCWPVMLFTHVGVPNHSTHVGDWSSGGVRLMDLNGRFNGQMDTMDGQEDVELEWELV